MPAFDNGNPRLPAYQTGPAPLPGQRSLPPLPRSFPPFETPLQLDRSRHSGPFLTPAAMEPFAVAALPSHTPSYNRLSPVRPQHEFGSSLGLPLPHAAMASASGTMLGATLAATPAGWSASMASPIDLGSYSLSGRIVPAAPTAAWAAPKPAPAIVFSPI